MNCSSTCLPIVLWCALIEKKWCCPNWFAPVNQSRSSRWVRDTSQIETATFNEHTNECVAVLKNANLAGTEFSGMLLETWSTVSTDDQWNETVNDACHLGAKAFPWRRNANQFSTTQSHNCDCGVPSVLKPASSDIISDSTLQWDIAVCFLHIQENGTHVCGPNTHFTWRWFWNAASLLWKMRLETVQVCNHHLRRDVTSQSCQDVATSLVPLCGRPYQYVHFPHHVWSKTSGQVHSPQYIVCTSWCQVSCVVEIFWVIWWASMLGVSASIKWWRAFARKITISFDAFSTWSFMSYLHSVIDWGNLFLAFFSFVTLVVVRRNKSSLD